MRRLTALVALLTGVVLPPVLLVAWGFTDIGAIRLWSISDARILLLLLTVIGWVAWGAWVLAVAIELADAVSGGRLRVRLPGLGAPRAVAAALIGAILVSGGAPVAMALPQAVAAPAPVAPPSAPAVAGVLSTQASPAQAAAQAAAAPGMSHTVTIGDDLWSLAERYYDDGTQWRQIVAANPSILADPLAELAPGTALTIPTPVILVTVVEGDSLWDLADTHLGDGERWGEIHDLNRGRVKDPDLIRPGWVLKVPRLVAPLSAAITADNAAPAEVAVPTPPADAPADPPAGAPVAEQAASPGSAEAVAESLAPDDEASPSLAGLVGGLSALSASAVMGGLAARRRLQEHARPLGRRYAQPTPDLASVEGALGRLRAAEPATPREVLLARAMRHLAAQWWADGVPAPELRVARVGPDEVEFEFTGSPPVAPAGFACVGTSVAVSWRAVADFDELSTPVAFPGLVTLGEDDAGRLLMVDVVTSGVLGLRPDASQDASEVLSAMLVELSCSPWAGDLDLMVVTSDPAFAAVAGEGRIVTEADIDAGVAAVERLVEQRTRFLDGARWDAARLDPDRAPAWGPQVVLFERAPDADHLARLEAAVGASPCGVAAVVPLAPEAAPEQSVDWVLTCADTGARRVEADAFQARPQTVPAPTRAALTSLFDLATTTTTEPAPWWPTPAPEDDVNIIALRPAPVPTLADGPRLSLLGSIELDGCTGDPPDRAVRQCMEYCAWLHLNPGGTPVQMTRALLVAEGTRRSNMSRLRSWLGMAPDGELYLPDAYSGRIRLHDDVTSDWQELSLLVAGGVERQPLERLLTALELVRGAPLADAAPGQWGWAEEFRSDASALIRDVAVVAARLARAKGDLDRSRWAANRGLVAAAEDELLLGERIRTEHAAGRTDEVRRLVQRVTRTARQLGSDLLPETVDLCQEVIEGRLRARA